MNPTGSNPSQFTVAVIPARYLSTRLPGKALLPIAGYEPLAMRETHMSPLDALYALEDLRADVLIPIAHGSFP